MTNEDRLRLYEIAAELEEFELDNGPMGSSAPFTSQAKELRRIAGRKGDSSQSSGDFRDTSYDYPFSR